MQIIYNNVTSDFLVNKSLAFTSFDLFDIPRRVIVTVRYFEPTKFNDDVDPTSKKDKRESKKGYTTITIVAAVAIISIDDANITTQNMDSKKY